MKLLLVLSACLAFAVAQAPSKSGFRRSQGITTPAPNPYEFRDDRDCDRETTKDDPFACLCSQLKLKPESCQQELQAMLDSQPNLKLCMDNPNYYLGKNQKCHYENVYESSADPAGKAMQFALNLFRTADPKNPEENFIISPLSPQVLLAQLTEGCSEEAKMEMVKGLLLNSNEAASLVNALHDAANKDSSANKLDIASVFFKSESVTLMPEFRRGAKMNKIPMQDIDFSNTFEAARTVNEWANMKTRGNIPQVITEQNLSPDMAMMLLNAIYFKGTWQYKFNQSETDRRATFQKANNKRMSVHMMSQTNRLRFGEINYGMYSDDEGLRWVELPYDGDQLSMIFFLPKVPHQLDEMLKMMNETHIQKIFKMIRRDHNPVKIHLKVPRFTIKSSVSLVEPLKKLGIQKIFEEDNSLSKLFKTPTRVGDVKQDAFLSVDEAGTTATAVSRVTIIPLSLNSYEDIYFECNEPFMVMVVDKTREIPLFMAKIRQPEKTKH
ncbi:leukocyte elastase inhibitor-like [Ochlerotatus camptorhynchus]|uniref:leukocyte elastase inhibitor-like n=1 Tax=Ochlerotatus camptorhynchus TaxID=644619 RepID=UPI0031D1A7F8